MKIKKSTLLLLCLATALLAFYTINHFVKRQAITEIKAAYQP